MENNRRLELTYNQEIWQLDFNIEPPQKGGEEARAFNRKVAQQKDLLEVIKILHSEEPRLLTGEREISLTEARVRGLFERVQKDCNGYQLRRRHNFFRNGLLRGEKILDWHIPIPDPMIILPRERSPFTPDAFVPLSSLQKLIDLFEKSFSNPIFYLDPLAYIKQAQTNGYRTKKAPLEAEHLLLGQIVFSAIVNGALLNKKWAAALLDGLTTSLVVRDKKLWIELQMSIGKGDMATPCYRRWFPDPTTAVLICYWQGKYSHNTVLPVVGKKEIFLSNLLNLYCACLGLQNNDRPSFAQLTAVAGTRHRLKLPPFLVTYAESLMLAPSLSPIGWARLQLSKIPCTIQANHRGKNVTQTDEGTPSTNQEFNPDNSLPDQLEKFRRLQKLFRKDRSKKYPATSKILDGIDQILAEKQLWPLTNALIEWAKKMLSERRNRKTNPANSVSQYLYAVGTPLLTYGDSWQIKDMSSVDWENLYDQVLETAISPNNRANKGRRLKDFHEFLMQNHNVPYVDIEDVAGGVKIADANIITPSEYWDIFNYLASNPLQTERMRRMHQILFCFCYRLGLRRDEVRRIRLIDFPDLLRLKDISPGSINDYDRFELHILNNPHGKVKTNKSIRRIPIHLFLTKGEIELLQGWLKFRLDEIGGKELEHQLLLCLAGDDLTLLSSSKIYKPIQVAMRKITHDSDVSIHTLRHSFASFLLLILFAGRFPELIPDLWRKRGNVDLLSEQLSLFHLQLLLREDLHSTRRLLYLVSNLCGHIDPAETQVTYLHLYDWMLSIFLKQQDHKIPQSVQAVFLGLSHANWRSERTRKKITAGNTAREFIEIQLSRTINYLDPMAGDMVPLSNIYKKDLRRDDPITLLHIFEHHANGIAVKEISNLYDCPIDLIERWIARAKQLCARKSSRGTPALGKKIRKAKLEKGEQHDYWPAIAPDKDDIADARMVFNALISPGNEENATIGRRGIELYLRRGTSSDSKIRPKTTEEKNFYVTFLKSVGFNEDRIMVTLYPNPDILAIYQQDHWAKILGIPIANILITCKNNEKRPIDPFGRPVIWVRRNRPDPQPKRPRCRQEYSQTSGIRLGIFMAAVYLGDTFDI